MYVMGYVKKLINSLDSAYSKIQVIKHYFYSLIMIY